MSKHPLTKTICIATLMIGCLFVILPVYGQPGDIPTRQDEAPVPSLDVLILVDESETMWNLTDPTNKRVQAVNLFIDQLSASIQPGVRHRVGIIAFGTEPKVIPWTFLDSQDDADRIKQEYQATQDAFGRSGYTDINKALVEALEIMKAEHDPARKPALILISDGQPTRPSPLVNEEQGWDVVYDYLLETRQIIEQFKAVSYTGNLCPVDSGTPLFTLAVGTDVLLKQGRSTQEFADLYKRFWQNLTYSTSGYYETVTPLDEVGSAVTEVFARLLCGVVYSTETEVEKVREFQFTVEQEYFQIFFTVSGKESPAIKSKVFRPGQENPIQSDGETIIWRSNADYELWSVKHSEPWAGTWQVVLEGKGDTYFSYVPLSTFSIEVRQPTRGAALPVGKPIEIRAQVIQKSKQPVVVPVQDFRVSVTKPDRTTAKQFNLEEWDGFYVGQFDDTDQKGEYTLDFNATLHDETKVYETTKVEFFPAPRLECVEPAKNSTCESDLPIPLEANVYLAGGTSKVDIELKAALLKSGEVVRETGLDCTETGESNVLACSGEFQPGCDPGAHVVNMILEAALPPGGIPVYDRSIVPIVILSPPTATPTHTLSPTVTPTLPPTAAPTPTPSPVPPTLTATETPTTISIPSPTATPTGIPTPPPPPPPTATPTLLEAVAMAALSNPSQCLLCVFAGFALFLLVLYMVGKRGQQPSGEVEGGKQEVEKGHPVLQELKAFIAFLKSLWGILAGISVFFPLSNALVKIIPLGTWAQGSGGLIYFSPHLVTVITTVTALFIILLTFSQRRQLRRITRKLQQQALYFFAFGLLALTIYLVVNFFVVAGCYERVLGWDDDSPLRLLGDVVLMLSYCTFFALITRAFVSLGVKFFGEK